MSKRSYGLEDKYRAAAATVASGSVEGASRKTGIPASTIRTWGHEEDFRTFCQEIRANYGDEIKGNLAQIVKEGTAEIRDRIKNGDYILDKHGKMIRRPMSGRDLTITTGVAFDKLRVIEGQPTHIVQQSEGLNRIRRLAHLMAGGKASIAGEKGAELFQDENEWWALLPESRKKAFQKAADEVATLAPDGAAVDPLKYIKQEVHAISECEDEDEGDGDG